jgi:hypothetical protein
VPLLAATITPVVEERWERVGQSDLRCGSRDAYGPDEEPHAALLLGEEILDARMRRWAKRPDR